MAPSIMTVPAGTTAVSLITDPTLAVSDGYSAFVIGSPTDPSFPGGYPRHGDNGTVDVAPRGLSTTDYDQEDLGPAIRFVAELDPVNGPTARNALPGGEIFDPTSPHYSDQMQLWRKNQTFDYAFKDGHAPNTRLGFFIEDIDDVAKNLSGSPLSRADAIDATLDVPTSSDPPMTACAMVGPFENVWICTSSPTSLK